MHESFRGETPLSTLSSTKGTNAGSTVYATWATPPGTFDCTFTLTVEDPLGLVQTASLPVNISSANLPPAPQNLVATPQGNAAINLAWSTVQVGTTLSYAIFRNTSPTLPTTALTTVAASQNSSQSFTDSSSLLSGLTYDYWVEAINASGYSPASSMESSQLSASTPTLTVPSNMTVTGTSAALSVTGTDPTGQNEPISYTWSIISSPRGASVQLNGAAPSATNTVTTITNLMNATFSQAGTYVFQVTAVDASGMSNAEDVTITVQQVATSVALNAANPTIFNGQTDTLTGTLLDQFGNPMSLSGASWSVQSGGIGGTVAAATVAGQATYTAPASADGSDTVILSVGSLTGSATVNVIQNSLTATAMSMTLVSLSWSPFSTAQYYQVFRDTTAGFTATYYNMIADSVTGSSYNDDTVSAGTTYYYQVYAVDGTGAATSIGSTGQGVSPSSTSGGSISPWAPQNVQATGVNDLEVLVTWTTPTDPDTQDALDGYWIQESTDGQNWFYVAQAPAGSTSWIVRGCGLGGSGFMQEGKTYYFRVVDEFNDGDGPPSAVVAASVLIPNDTIDAGDDVILIVGSRNWSMERLLAGISINTTGSGRLLIGQTAAGNTVGMIWADLVDKGYNVFLVPDPEDGGSYSPVGASNSYLQLADGSRLYSTLNNDGSGRIYDEIMQEFNTGIYDLGLIGWSHGAGMTENISLRLLADPNRPMFARVVVADTIDGIQYGPGPDSPPPGGPNGWYVNSPMILSPVVGWAGGFGFNYWTPNGIWTPTGQVQGGPLIGAFNYPPYNSLNHVTIGRDWGVLSSVESDVTYVYGMLSS